MLERLAREFPELFCNTITHASIRDIAALICACRLFRTVTPVERRWQVAWAARARPHLHAIRGCWHLLRKHDTACDDAARSYISIATMRGQLIVVYMSRRDQRGGCDFTTIRRTVDGLQCMCTIIFDNRKRIVGPQLVNRITRLTQYHRCACYK